MIAMMPTPEQCANHAKEVEKSVQLPQSSPLASAFYVSGRLWNVVALNVQANCTAKKTAQVFIQEVEDQLREADNISYELSWQREDQISELLVHLKYSQRTLDMINTAIVYTSLDEKKSALAKLALTLMRVKGEVDGMLVPSNRRGPEFRAVAGLRAITPDTLTLEDLQDTLQHNGAPFYNHVEQIANMLDLANRRHVRALKQLDLMHLLYLYEEKHVPEFTKLILDKYMALKLQNGEEDILGKMRFKNYLYVNKASLGDNDCYTRLLEAIEKTERS